MVHETLGINYFACCGLAIPPFAVTYHQQDARGSKLHCGAATAQMILGSIESGPNLIDQIDLYNSNRSNSAADSVVWHAGPDGLETTLNTLKPTTFTNVFQYFDLTAEEAISRKICWAIHEHQVAAAALVEGGRHWITVVGYTASDEPASADDTTYEIESFDVYNPWPPTPSPTPPPLHTDGADNCGTGKSTGKNRGNEFEVIIYKKPGSGSSSKKYWRTYYMMPVARGNLWKDRYFAVCDPESPAEIEDVPPEFDTERETSLEVIQGLADQGMTDFGLRERGPWRDALEGTGVGDPLLVEREGFDPQQYYYLVPFNSDGTVPVLAQVDAYVDGSLMGAIAVSDGTTHFADALVDIETVTDDVAERVFDEVGVEIYADHLHDSLVWRPCAESLSPYWPFYRFDEETENGPVQVYVRIDGEVFTELHEEMGM